MNRVLLRFPNFKAKAFTLSYDDGVRQDKRLVSIMKRYNIKGTFNINSGRFSDEYAGEEKGHMTIDEALELYKCDNCEVAVHGVEHLSLAESPTELAVYDIISDRLNLENIFGGIIKGMAYANGSLSDDVVNILKCCGINYSRTTLSTESFIIPENWLKLNPTCHHDNPRIFDLAKTFIETDYTNAYFWGRKPLLFYVWGHSYEFDNNNNWERIEKLLEYVSNKDDVWYATNGEIYNYVKAYDSLIFSVDGKTITNPTSTDVYLSYIGNINVLVPKGETITIK